ncbi:hypothetical protein ACFLT4_04105 [Chloroflexota bacterium]
MNKKECLKVLATIGIFALLVANATACAVTTDFEVISEVTAGHTHEITIWGTDIDRPPAEGRDKDSSPWEHKVHLTKQDFQALKEGRQITVTSNPAESDGHTHIFIIKKPSM